jgi:hypothetical protein
MQAELITSEKWGFQYYALNGERLSSFPVSRPLNERVHVFTEAGEYLGEGVGAECRHTGGCIKLDDHKYDSNHTLLWAYAQ